MRPRFLESMSYEMAEVYEAISDQILINLARHFPFYVAENVPTSAFAYQAGKLAEMGQVNRETMRIIRQGLAGADDALKSCLEQSIMDAVAHETPELWGAVRNGILLPPGIPEVAPNQFRAFQLYYKQSADRLNLVNTVMLESTQQAFQLTVADIANRVQVTQSALNIGAGETITGVSSWNQAVKHATDRMKAGGVVGFIDHAGRHWSAESYVAMDIRTTMFNTARAAIWETNENFGNDLYLVSTHAGARPLCYDWQNRVISATDNSRTTYDLDGNEVHVWAQSETTYGEPAGLFGINCKHYPTPFIPGVSVADGHPQSKEDNDREYEQTQKQRGLERKIREEKRDLEMLRAQNAPDELIDAQKKRVRATSSEIDDFCNETGLPRRRNRESVYTQREFPTPGSYDPKTFISDQKAFIDQYYQTGGAQKRFSFGQMVPNVPIVPNTTTRFYDAYGDAPKRPERSDFVNYEEYDTARKQYRIEREQYKEKVGSWFDENYGGKSITDEQLNQWMERHGIVQYGSLDGIDRRALAAYTERFDELDTQFPQVLGHRKSVGLPFEISFDASRAFTAEASTGMTFGGVYSDFRLVAIDAANVANTGMVHGINPVLQTFDHEFGHNLFDAMRRLGEEVTPELTRMRVAMEEDLVTSLRGLPGISDYATTNVDELFAEGFSAWYGGEKTPFANAFGEYLHRWGAL